MADFPENQFEVFEEYVSDDFFRGLVAGFSRDGLTGDIAFDDIEPTSARNDLRQIARARRGILNFFNDPRVKERQTALRTVAEEMSRGTFDGAQTQLTSLVTAPALTFSFDFDRAFNLAPVSFTVVELQENPTPGKPPIKKRTPATIPAYSGPKPSDAPGRRLLVLNEFMAQGAEHRFRTELVQAEIDAGARRFADAIARYNQLLVASSPESPRRKFLALRSAFAQLAGADQAFRRQRVLSEGERQSIGDRYDAVVKLLQDNGVSPENPLRRQVEAHVSQQQAKLQNNLNVLGLFDAFVPVQTFRALQQAALAQVEIAGTSVAKFIEFLEKADQKKVEELDLQFQTDEETRSLDVLARKRAIARLGVDKIDEQLDDIGRQREILDRETVLGGVRAVFGAASAGPAASGLITTMFKFGDQAEQLAHQRRLAEIDKQIALNELGIVRLEREIAEQRLAFYGEKLAFLKDRRLNHEMLSTLAALNERRAERQLEAAILLAYLFERSLSFFLGVVDLRHIQFDYLDRPAGIFGAVEALAADLNLVAQELTSVTQEKFDTFEETISLRESYPIQFSQFLQTGEMDFVYSLYELSKSRPATHQCRLREVGVEIRGLVPATGFSGTLTHSGRFAVRDRGATLDPSVTRLVPTEDALATALVEQRRQGLAAAVVEGVLHYSVPPESKELSQKTQFVSPVVPSDLTLEVFEGIGPTGLWHLEIRDHGKLSVTDILLHFAIVSRESDPFQLESKVESLTRAFEQELAEGDRLDKISAFSLRQNFSDTFFALQNGRATLTLAAENFPNGLTNLQFKTVVAQALDKDGKGVAGIALEISRPDAAFSLLPVTEADGFSEKLDVAPTGLPPDQRFPVTGAWQIALSTPSQFAELNDLRLFFMYAFEEL